MRWQWVETGQMVAVDTTLYVGIRTATHEIAASLDFDLSPLLEELQLKHKNRVGYNQNKDFNSQINDLNIEDVSNIYDLIYFGNLCTALTLNEEQLS